MKSVQVEAPGLAIPWLQAPLALPGCVVANDNRPDAPRVAAGSASPAPEARVAPPADDKPADDKPSGPKPKEDDDDGDPPPEGGNRPPRVSGPVHLADMASCAVLAIGLAQLLRHAEDPDGGWDYRPDPGYSGPVTLSYQIGDGQASIIQTAHFTVFERHFIQGTDGDDNLLGGACAEDIDGGDDRIFGQQGNDIIHGEAGDDLLDGGAGDHYLDGGAGNDVLSDGVGSDVVRGGRGGRGEDHVIAALDGRDSSLDGGAGLDTLDYSAATDSLVIDWMPVSSAGSRSAPTASPASRRSAAARATIISSWATIRSAWRAAGATISSNSLPRRCPLIPRPRPRRAVSRSRISRSGTGCACRNTTCSSGSSTATRMSSRRSTARMSTMTISASASAMKATTASTGPCRGRFQPRRHLRDHTLEGRHLLVIVEHGLA